MDVIYDIKDETVFDGMVTQLKDMTEQEQQHFMVLLQGYRAGVQAGLGIAAKEHQGESA